MDDREWCPRAITTCCFLGCSCAGSNIRLKTGTLPQNAGVPSSDLTALPNACLTNYFLPVQFLSFFWILWLADFSHFSIYISCSTNSLCNNYIPSKEIVLAFTGSVFFFTVWYITVIFFTVMNLPFKCTFINFSVSLESSIK